MIDLLAASVLFVTFNVTAVKSFMIVCMIKSI